MTESATDLEWTIVRSDVQIDQVVRLAQQIWSEHYLSIIGQAQINYMLAQFQSHTAISAQLRAGYDYYLLSHQHELAGYAAVCSELEQRCLFVSKLYLLKKVRGRGLGRLALTELSRLAATRKLERLRLTVNKRNPALQAYLRFGFEVRAEVVTDIGAGYVMDDYELEWPVQAGTFSGSGRVGQQQVVAGSRVS